MDLCTDNVMFHSDINKKHKYLAIRTMNWHSCRHLCNFIVIINIKLI